MLRVRCARVSSAVDLPLPSYGSAAAAGMDLRAAVAEGGLVVPVGGHAIVPTGLIFEIPAGHEGQVRPRSGLAARHGLTVLNSPGTIDADYRGEVQVVLINHGQQPFTIQRGDRIAQLVIAPVLVAQIEEAAPDELTTTDRAAGGFGSTGVA